MKKNGFTLIELMITVAIVAILAAIAYPSYQDSVRKTKRTTAQADLMELASFMERKFTENNSYAGTTIASIGVTNDDYTLALTLPTAPVTSYTLTAVPQGAQADDSCGTLSLSNTGVKEAKVDGVVMPSCW